jgi:hypothetical protein
MSPKQKKLAAKAPPPNKIDAKDFAVLRAEKAKGRGMGLQDESVQPGKVMKAKKGSGLDLPVIKSVEPKINKKSLHKNLMKTKNPYSDLVKTTAKGPPRFSSMEEMRRAKGFKPGESAKDFNKRKAAEAFAKKAAKATGARGKIALGIAAAGVGAAQYLKSKMKKKDKKMGGGMMKKPMGYDRGGMYLTDEKVKKVFPEKDAKSRANISQLVGGDRVSPMKKERFTAGQSARRKEIIKNLIGAAKATPLGLGIKVAEAAKKIKEKVKSRAEGGPATRPMGYRSGTSVKVKCKLGRNKPTKMY